MTTCYCGSSSSYNKCCGIYHQDHTLVPNAEALMRSRFSAYTLHLIDYLIETTLPSERKYINRNDMTEWAVRNKWIGLEIIKSTEHTVEFKAHFLNEMLNPQIHHERSTFKKLNGKWYYDSGRSVS